MEHASFDRALEGVHDPAEVCGRRVIEQRLRLKRDDFVPPVPVEIHGLEACLADFGI